MEPVIEFRSDQENIKPIFACGRCRTIAMKLGWSTKEAAVNCCVCEFCGNLPKLEFRTICEVCDHERREKRQQDLAAKRAAITVVEYDGSPVYWDQREEFFGSLEECQEKIWDEGEDRFDPLVHPCRVSQLPVPCLVDFIEERWTDEWEDSALTQKDAAALAAIEKEIEAPIVWHPITDKRIALDWSKFKKGTDDEKGSTDIAVGYA